MGIKRVIATILNIQDGKPAAEGNYDYLKEALTKGSTTTEGGLVLSNVLAVKRTDGSVASYINGLTGNPTALAAGVENFGTVNETKKAEITHEGGITGTHVVFKSPNLETEGGIFFSSLAKALSFHYQGGQKGLDIKLLPEGPAISLYAPTGELVWQLGQGGFYYINSVPESLNSTYPFVFTGFTQEDFNSVPSIDLKSFIGVYYRKNSLNDNDGQPTDGYSNSLSFYKILMYSNSNTHTYYYYNPGNNEYSQSNAQYKGFHITANKTSAFIPNGWYITDTELSGDNEKFDINIVEPVYVQLVYYKNGSPLKYQQFIMSTNDFDGW